MSIIRLKQIAMTMGVAGIFVILSLLLSVQLIPKTSLSFALTLNFFLMIWISLLEELFTFQLKGSYFEAKSFEKEGTMYRYLGVRRYGKFLSRIGWEKDRRDKYPIKKDMASLKRFEYRTRMSEAGHGLIGGLVLINSLFVIFVHSLSGAKWLLITNLFLNGYPMMLQRYNRPRVLRLINKLALEKGEE